MLRLEDCINETCPWSGKPVQADSLTRYQGRVVGFCNPGCRGRFEQAIAYFERARERAGKTPGHTSSSGSRARRGLRAPGFVSGRARRYGAPPPAREGIVTAE